MTTLVLAAACSAVPLHATSLYEPASFQPFTSDLRPRRVGDLITVMVYETSSASSSANTSAGRNAGVGVEARTPVKGYEAGVKVLVSDVNKVLRDEAKTRRSTASAT